LVWEQTVWDFELNDHAEESSLDGCLRRLIEALSERGEKLRKLAEISDARAMLWCACYGSGPEMSLAITRDVLDGMARMGLELNLSIYEASDV
jgi:hypothetical protein